MLYKNLIQLFEMPFMHNNMYSCRRIFFTRGTYLHEVYIHADVVDLCKWLMFLLNIFLHIQKKMVRNN